MDPNLLAMLLGSGVNPEGAADPMLNPAGSMPMGGQQMANPMNLATGGAPSTPSPAAPGGNSLGQLLQGVKAPEAQAPKFSGGVTGSGLPYVSRAEDMVNPFLQATGAAKPQMLPTLGALLAQGGGR